jgi:hypothetical protein
MQNGAIITVLDLEYLYLNGHFYPNQPDMLAFYYAQSQAEEENLKRDRLAGC